MYKLICILFLILQNNTSFSKQVSPSLNYKPSSVTTDSVIDALSKKNKLLESQNELITTALNVNSSVFSGISTYFAVISILLTIIVVILPLVNYFFVLKPSEKAMRKVAVLEGELLSRVENNFEDYLLKIEHKKAKDLIRSLDTGPQAITAFANFFLLRSYSDFDVEDQNTVINFLEKKYEIEVINRLTLHNVLTSNPSRSCEAFYKKVLETGDKPNHEYAINYLVDNHPEDNIAFFELIIVNSPDGHKILREIIRHIEDDYIGSPMGSLKISETRAIGEQKIKLFLDNTKICDSVENKKADYHHQNISFMSFAQNAFIKETYYFKKYKQKD
jgi:hypothetical protein